MKGKGEVLGDCGKTSGKGGKGGQRGRHEKWCEDHRNVRG